MKGGKPKENNPSAVAPARSTSCGFSTEIARDALSAEDRDVRLPRLSDQLHPFRATEFCPASTAIARSCYFCRNANRFDSDHRNIEAHVLIWLCDFDHDRVFAAKRSAASDRFVRAFKRFDREHRAVFHDDGLPDIEPADFFCDLQSERDVFFFASR